MNRVYFIMTRKKGILKTVSVLNKFNTDYTCKSIAINKYQEGENKIVKEDTKAVMHIDTLKSGMVNYNLKLKKKNRFQAL